MSADRADEGQHRGRKPPAGHRDQRDDPNDFRFADGLSANPRDGRRKLGQETDAETGRDHHLNPVFSFALKANTRTAIIGAMWWQQSLWKLPPYYTDHPEQPFGDTGLAYWMKLLGQHAAIPLQADLVNNVVLPHFYWFAPVVYGLEVLTGVSLMLGVFVRLFAGRAADSQSLARPLQRARRVALDLFFPARADADLCRSPLRPQPRPRRKS